MSFFSSWFTSPDKHPEKHNQAFPYLLKQIFDYSGHLRPQRWNWNFLIRSLDGHIGRSSSAPLTKERVAGLRNFLFDGLFASFSDGFFVNYIVLYALAFSAGNSQIGFLTAFGNLLGTVALFPGARHVDRFGKKKAIVVGAGGIGSRLCILLLALIPLFTRDGFTAIMLIIVFNGIRSFLSNYANPAWTAMVADLVPNNMRGRYFTLRNTLIGVAGFVVAPVAGYIIRHGNGKWGLAELGYQAVFVLAFAAGLVSTVFFSRIPEEHPEGTGRRKHVKGDLRKALRGNLPFVGLLVSSGIWNLAVQFPAPFFSVHMVTNLHATAYEVGISTAFTSLGMLLGQFYYGWKIDRKGDVRVQSLSGCLIPLLPISWVFFTEPWHVYVVNVVGAFLWAGYNMTNFNLLLSLSPEAQRPRAVALYQTVVFSAAVVGPLIGGYLADIISYKSMFVMSGVGRFFGMAVFLVMVTRPVLRAGRAGAGSQPGELLTK